MRMTALGTPRRWPNTCALKALGVETFSSSVSDGHSEYFGSNGYTIRSPAVYEELPIADTSDR
jgi:hypothetical protein